MACPPNPYAATPTNPCGSPNGSCTGLTCTCCRPVATYSTSGGIPKIIITYPYVDPTCLQVTSYEITTQVNSGPQITVTVPFGTPTTYVIPTQDPQLTPVDLSDRISWIVTANCLNGSFSLPETGDNYQPCPAATFGPPQYGLQGSLYVMEVPYLTGSCQCCDTVQFEFWHSSPLGGYSENETYAPYELPKTLNTPYGVTVNLECTGTSIKASMCVADAGSQITIDSFHIRTTCTPGGNDDLVTLPAPVLLPQCDPCQPVYDAPQLITNPNDYEVHFIISNFVCGCCTLRDLRLAFVTTETPTGFPPLPGPTLGSTVFATDPNNPNNRAKIDTYCDATGIHIKMCQIAGLGGTGVSFNSFNILGNCSGEGPLPSDQYFFYQEPSPVLLPNCV